MNNHLCHTAGFHHFFCCLVIFFFTFLSTTTVSHWKYAMMTFASLNGNRLFNWFWPTTFTLSPNTVFAVNITWSWFPYQICICNYFIISFQFLESGFVDKRCTYHIDLLMVHTFTDFLEVLIDWNHPQWP